MGIWIDILVVHVKDAEQIFDAFAWHNPAYKEDVGSPSLSESAQQVRISRHLFKRLLRQKDW